MCTIGLVVEYVVAIDVTRVRFPDGAYYIRYSSLFFLRRHKVLPRFELGLQGSESGVLTVTPQDRRFAKVYLGYAVPSYRAEKIPRPGIEPGSSA